MNKIVIFLCCIVLFSACPNDDAVVDKLNVIPEDIAFDANDDEEIFVDVITNVKTWSATPSDGWIKVNQVADGFYVSVEPHTDVNRARTGRITVKAGGAEVVTVIVTQHNATPNEAVTTYNACIGEYWGDFFDIGTADFSLDMYNTSDNGIGLWIEGFCTLPSSFENFKLDAGVYSVAETGDALLNAPWNQSAS